MAPETDGVTCDIDDPVARALCERPELRSAEPAELADLLGISAVEAQVGILRLASKMAGVQVVLRGVSFDQAIAAGGRKMPRAKVAYAPDVSGLSNGAGGKTFVEKAKEAAPVVGVLAAFFGALLLDKPEE
jgi:hypothetical protein